MPLGASRLSFLAKTAEAAAPPSQRTAKTLTVGGNAQIDTAQYKFGGSSMLFDGTDDYVSIPTSAGGDLDFGSNDFTIEAWIRLSDTSGVETILSNWGTEPSVGSVGDRTYYFGTNGANLVFYFYHSSGTIDVSCAGAGLSATTWHHVAVVGDSSNFKIYIDGTQVDSTTRQTIDTTTAEVPVSIGLSGVGAASNFDFNGHIDELRISNNTRYTAGFTPSTTPFVNDSNTLLLVHADGTDGDTVFIDDNGDRAPVGVVAIGNAQVSTTQNKIGTKSLYFDGSGDYLKLWNPELTNWGTGDFTIEFWLKTSDSGLNLVQSNNSTYDDGFTISAFGTQLRFYSYTAGTTVAFSPESIDYTDNAWHHCAIVRNSGSVTFYMDGTAGTAASHTSSYSTILLNGAHCIVGESFEGYIDELRISDTARYTTSFTPSTTAFENDANTLLLLHAEEGANGTTLIFDDNGHTNVLPPPDYTVPTAAFTSDANTEFLCSWDGTNGQTSATDESSNSHTITFSGTSADLSTTEAKFGTASVDINFSSTDSITFGDSGTSAWYNQDTTIECWVYYDTLTGAQASNGLPRVMGSFVAVGGGNYWSFGAKDDGSLQFFYYQGAGNYITSATGVISAGQWHHIAMVYNHSTGAIRLLCDGFEVASGTKAAGSFANHGYVRLGNYSGTPDAYVDEIRISHTQRY